MTSPTLPQHPNHHDTPITLSTADTSHSPLPQTNDDARSELTAQLEDLLNTLSNKLAGVSSEIFAKSKPSFRPHLT